MNYQGLQYYKAAYLLPLSLIEGKQSNCRTGLNIKIKYYHLLDSNAKKEYFV